MTKLQRQRPEGRTIEPLIPPCETIARLNDRVRRGLDRSARIVITHGCMDAFCSGDMPQALLAQAELLRCIRKHDFTEDAHGERDFGTLTFRGHAVFFKIDYFDLALEYGSENPADASQTTRVMTIMLSEEY